MTFSIARGPLSLRDAGRVLQNLEPPARQRRRLPDRRESFAIEFEGQRFSVAVGRFDDGGAPAEAFISAAKAGSGYDDLAHDCGVLLSFALQSGADLSTIRHGLTRGADSKAASLLGAVVDALTGKAEE